jgi:hypothetical protein
MLLRYRLIVLVYFFSAAVAFVCFSNGDGSGGFDAQAFWQFLAVVPTAIAVVILLLAWTVNPNPTRPPPPPSY